MFEHRVYRDGFAKAPTQPFRHVQAEMAAGCRQHAVWARAGREFDNPSGDRSWIRIRLRVLGTNFAEEQKNNGGKLTHDDLNQLDGYAEQLAGKLREHYGLSLEDAERQANEFRRRIHRN